MARKRAFTTDEALSEFFMDEESEFEPSSGESDHEDDFSINSSVDLDWVSW